MRNKADVIDLSLARARLRTRAAGERHLATIPENPTPTSPPYPFAPILAATFAAWSIGFGVGLAWGGWWR